MVKPARILVLAALLPSGCGLPDAPTRLDELSLFLFANFEEEDPDLLGTGLGNLHAFFERRGVDQDFDDQAWELAPLGEAELAGIAHPDRDPAAALPVGLVMASAFPPTEQARVIVLPDQTPVEPSSPELYERTFLEPSDPSCFPEAGCALLRTDNRIRKENALMSIDYSKRKDFRWSEVPLAEGGAPGILARSWMEAEAWGEEGNTAILQAYGLDVFLPDGAGGCWRYLAMWSEAEMFGASDEMIQATLHDGMEDVLVETERWLEEHPG